MSKLLWIGSYVDENVFLEMQFLGYRNSASYVSQRNILEGIEKVTNRVFDTVSCLVFPDYPTCPSKYIERKVFHHDKTSYDVLAGYKNVKFVNRLLSKKSLKNEALCWIGERNPANDPVDIFVYEMRSACLEAAIAVKKRIAGSKIHLIVPDLPQFMDLQMSIMKKMLKSRDWKAINRALAAVDSFILYTVQMAAFLKLEGKKWMVMEGSIHEKEIESSKAVTLHNNKICVMYSGYLNEEFGLDRLVSAFSNLDSNYELWVSGSGPAERMLKESAASDKRIRFFGYLPTRKELDQKQQQATMMINMRDPSNLSSDYCFPSKLFEYMLSGKPVLSPRLGGIPAEYYRYLAVMDGIEPYQIAESIKKVALMKNKSQFGTAAREFIAKEKNNTAQSQRIVDFLL